jgi:hypothetical protein
MRRLLRAARSQGGQAIVMMGLMMIVLLCGVGLAVDSATGYYYNTAAERAAAAAALSGVVFMPNQFSTAQSRALAEAKRNRFDTADTANNVQVTASVVSGSPNELQVTVSRTVPTVFMSMFGVRSYTVQRTAIAQYLPPISLGQSGSQVGSQVSDLGNTGFYFIRTEGSATDRGQGDAFTPANKPLVACAACPSTDVHVLSQTRGTDLADTSLPNRGGYNYRIIVPAGSSAIVQVYNAAFAPDDNSVLGGSGINYCENAKPGSAFRTCAAAGSNYHMHEEDCCSFIADDPTTYSTTKYTLFSEPNVFTPSADVKLSQMTVDPLDARGWQGSPPTYKDVRTGSTITQSFNGNGTPRNGLAYHAWMNVHSKALDPNDQGMISYTPGFGPLSGALGPGQYRLRIDTLEWDGSNPPANGTAGTAYAHKGLGVRVQDAAGLNPCSACSLSAINDFAIFTPIAIAGGGSFSVPLFQLPPDYAGKTISVGVFDLGDMSGNGNIYVSFVDPRTGNPLDLTGTGTTATVWNLGSQLSNFGTPSASVVSNPTVVEQLVTSGSNFYAANNWYQFDIPIPTTYNPGTNPANWWWKLKYRTTGNVTAADTITVTVGLKGNPVHLIQS